MKLRGIFITAVALLILILPSTAFADTVLTVRPGLNGLYKTRLPVQLNISIANNGPAIKNGLLVVKANPKQLERIESAIYQRKISIPANQRLETSLVIPGDMAKYEPKVYLLSNGMEIASTLVQGVAVRGDFIGISVGQQPLSNGLPVWLENSMNNTVTFKYMSPVEIPANQMVLGTADLIVLDKQKAGELSPAQITTIRQWVTLGGVLLLSGGAGAAEGQPFADISPVLVTGKTTLSGNWNGMRAGSSSIPVAKGTFVVGEKLLEQNNIPLIARRSIGRGYVVYSAAGLENLTAKDNKVWEALLKINNRPLMRDRDSYYHSSNRLKHASANIPQLQLPSIAYLAGVWGLYIIVIAPGLYLLLKRYNRRDWAWIGIPAVAVLTATMIYYCAPLHRLNGPLGQTLAVVEILDENVAEIRSGGSYVSPNRGELLLTDAHQGLIMPEIRYHNGQWEQPPVIKYTEQGQEVHFDQVGYWSLRQTSNYKIVDDFGQIKGELKLVRSKITGTLENKTGINLEKCLAVIGDKAIEIGKLPAGSSVNIDADLTGVKPFSWEHNLENWFLDQESVNVYEDYIVETKKISSERNEFNAVQLVGFGKNIPGLMQLKHDQAENYSKAMITQNIPLTLPESGEFRLPNGFISAKIIENDGDIEYTPDGFMIYSGRVTMEFNLNLPVQYRQVDVQVVEFSNLVADSNYKVRIFDWSKQQWDDLKPSQKRLTGTELKPYVSKNNRLRLNVQRYEKASYEVMPMPGLAVEGVVK